MASIPGIASLHVRSDRASNRAQYMYTKTQSAVRSCVERVFGVLLQRFGIISRPGRLWLSTDMNAILKTCAIIQNIITEERKAYYTEDIMEYLNCFATDSSTPSPESAILTPINTHNTSEFDTFLARSHIADEVRNGDDHDRLRAALMQLHAT